MPASVPTKPRAHVLTWLVFISICWLFLFANTQRHFTPRDEGQYGTIDTGWPLTFSSPSALVAPAVDEKTASFAVADTGSAPLKFDRGYAIPFSPGKAKINLIDIIKPLACFLADACIALGGAFLSASFCEALCRKIQ